MFERTTYASEKGDKKDCAVRSFAVAACVSYDSAHKAFESFGRLPNKGTLDTVSESVIDFHFPNRLHLWNPGLTLPKFAQKYNEGHWIVHVRHHALAVVDGVIHDWRLRPKTKVIRAWRLDA